MSPLAFLGRIPRDEAFPEEHHGEHCVALLTMYAGSVQEGEDRPTCLNQNIEPTA